MVAAAAAAGEPKSEGMDDEVPPRPTLPPTPPRLPFARDFASRDFAAETVTEADEVEENDRVVAAAEANGPEEDEKAETTPAGAVVVEAVAAAEEEEDEGDDAVGR